MAEKKVNGTAISLKLKRKHPRNSFRVGGHVVTRVFQEFTMSKKEMKEIENKGCQHWVISKKDFEKAKAEKAAAKKKKEK